MMVKIRRSTGSMVHASGLLVRYDADTGTRQEREEKRPSFTHTQHKSVCMATTSPGPEVVAGLYSTKHMAPPLSNITEPVHVFFIHDVSFQDI